jgi:transglutaminase-like putative cysteine protease
MRYTLSHITRFSYSAPISEGVSELRLQPRSEANQRCLSFGVSTNPTSRIFAYRDSLGNTVHYFDIPGRHDQLEIASEALVEVAAPVWELPGLAAGPINPDAAPAPLPADTWERLHASRNTGVHYDDLSPSRFALFTPALRAFHDELGLPEGLDPLALALSLTQRIHALMAYNPGATRVDSPIDEALAARRGVCQDYSHIMLALCRLRGLPARYVSGYLFTGGGEGNQSSPDASHAWVEVWLPALGWIGLDPTNNLVAGERHIRVAIGRDYDDVPPVRGVFKGSSESALHVAVRVEQAEPEAPDAIVPAVAWPPILSGEMRQQPLAQSQSQPSSDQSQSQQQQ